MIRFKIPKKWQGSVYSYRKGGIVRIGCRMFSFRQWAKVMTLLHEVKTSEKTHKYITVTEAYGRHIYGITKRGMYRIWAKKKEFPYPKDAPDVTGRDMERITKYVMKEMNNGTTKKPVL